jgi:hypothetical protein
MESDLSGPGDDSDLVLFWQVEPHAGGFHLPQRSTPA